MVQMVNSMETKECHYCGYTITCCGLCNKCPMEGIKIGNEWFCDTACLNTYSGIDDEET
jgi:hypothetical protein